MARQNRVTPFGEIIATPERGTCMGNRGVLHDGGTLIKRPWQVNRWILCRLDSNGRKRFVMAPHRYTELFFLDEATGLAAGHRPCFECRRKSFLAFRDAWAAGNPALAGDGPTTVAILDGRLHSERVGPGRSKKTHRARLGDLPDGAFVIRDGDEARARLIWKGRLLAWSPGGYGKASPKKPGEVVSVLTPRSSVEAIRAGYAPEVHVSARADPASPPSGP